MISINKEEQKTVSSIFQKIGDQFGVDQTTAIKKQFQRCIDRIHKRLQKGIKYRNISKLAPIILFMFLKVKNISFQKKKFLETLDLEEEEFNRGLKRIVPAYPAYQERDRIDIIGSKLKDVLTEYELSNGFLKRCEGIFKYFYPRISHSTDGTITGVLAVLSLLSLDIDDISLSEVCEYSGTTLGSVHNAIKRIIFNEKERSQFQGLIKSKSMVKDKIAEKIGSQLNIQVRKSKSQKPVSGLRKNKSSKTQHIHSKKEKYELPDKSMQEIIRFHFFELSAEKIANHLNINLGTVKSVLEDFTEGNISFESREAPNLGEERRADMKSFNLKKNPFPQYGKIVKIEKLPVICEKCKNPLLKLVYEHQKTIFFCRYCFK